MLIGLMNIEILKQMNAIFRMWFYILELARHDCSHTKY